MIKIQLPEAFGTNTIIGVIYEMAEKQGGADPDVIMKGMLKVPLVMSTGIRSLKQLAFIVSEAQAFIAWAKRVYDIEPEVTFV